MNTERKIAITAGVLFIIATAASLAGSSVTDPILDAPDYLAGFAANGTRIIVGTLLAFVAAIGSSSIAIALYPVLKKHSEGLALGAVAFRVIEGIFYSLSAIGLLSLLSLSNQFVSAGSPSGSDFQTIAGLLLAARDISGFVFGVIAFCLGAFMYYYVFYQSKLIPRWLSVWGLIAVVMLLSAVFITLFDGEPYAISGNLLVLVLPIFLQELVLAVWLIAKGFNPSALASGAA